MQLIDEHEDTLRTGETERNPDAWRHVARDVLGFQVKLVAEGIKDLFLAQVALGAALVDLWRRDGTAGRRFYAVVRMSDRFDRWLDLHEPMDRVPDDAPEYVPPVGHSVDDLIDGVERSAREVVRRSRELTARGLETFRARAARASSPESPSCPSAREMPGRA